MTATISDAVELYHAGRLEEAADGCRAIIGAQPEHADAVQLLETILRQTGAQDVARSLVDTVPHYHNATGAALQREGRLADALVAYERALQIKPDYVEAHSNRGVVLQRLGHLEESLAAHDQALRLNPNRVEVQLNRAATLQEMGRLTEALAAYDDASRGKPELAPVHRNRANALRAMGRFREALTALDRAVRINPDYLEAHVERGVLLQQQGRLEEARAAYDAALRLNPDLAGMHLNRGIVLQGLGQLDAALVAYDRAIDLKPDLAHAHLNRGAILRHRGRLDEALAAFDRSLELNSTLALAHSNRGALLRAQGRIGDSIVALGRALELDPDLVHAYVNLGVALEGLGRLNAAVAAFDQALRREPDGVEAHVNRGNALNGQGRFAEALEDYRQALRVRPDFDDAHSNYLYCLNYDPAADDATLLEAHVAWGDRHWSAVGAYANQTSAPDPEKTLRVGLVSADLGRHPVGYVVAPLLAAVNPDAMEFFAYSGRINEDDLTEQIKAKVIEWRSTLGIPDAELAEQIHADGIDILIDLSGHTSGNRLPMFALKPAPVQATWIGYPHTTGLAAIDYVLMDEATVPPGAERWFVEQVVRLPGTRLCYAPPDYAPPPGPPPALERGVITFGSFNKLSKVTPAVLRLWARILLSVPDARLVLKWETLIEAETQAEFTRRLEDLGVDPTRLKLRAGSPHAAMLAEYGDVDIALDPFPYSGGLTSLEALWQGLPVVTLPKSRPVARQTQAFLRALGRADWIAKDDDDYVRIAVELARDPESLAVLRRDLRAQMAVSPLCDGPRFARHFEAAMREMWRTWCSAAAPGPGAA